jgi:hypothetical protein
MMPPKAMHMVVPEKLYGTTWKREALLEEISRQLGDAADRVCPDCARQDFQKANA